MKIQNSLSLYETRPNLPNYSAFCRKIREIFKSRFLTNNGKQVQRFEKELKKFLGVRNVTVFCNGTLALQLALQALKLTGEVITTPFTFPATTFALSYNNLTPVFCDIESIYCNLDPDKIEPLITKKTSAILPVHIFGNPCQVDKIQKIADKYGLKVIYDAAHAFGVKVNNKPIGTFGDISMFSFHATKKFNTLEGGALVYKDNRLKKKLESLKNFGYDDKSNIISLGTNAKMNEIQAVFGFLLFKDIEKMRKERKHLFKLYRNKLKVDYIQDIKGVKHNYLYFVIKIEKRNRIYNILQKYGIDSRKRFYQLCSDILDYKNLPSSKNLPIAQELSKKTLSLPLYNGLTENDINKICRIINSIC